MKTPLLLIGDGPHEPTGLGRILRDLAARTRETFGDQIDLLTVGGSYPPVWTAWPHVPVPLADRSEDWGAAYLAEVYRSVFGRRPGILWHVWDPARVWPSTAIDLPVVRWGYFPVDGDTVQGSLPGVAGEAVRRMDRVIGYGRWGAGVLRTLRSSPVPYLPHGIDLAPFAADQTAAEGDWVQEVLGPTYKRGQRVIGVVATNSARKDWGLVCWTLRELIDRGHPVFGWFHTDTLVKDWALPGLIADFGLADRVRVSGVGEVWSDRQLAVMYQACAVTIAPGMAEGFGFPIVESLASGTPVVHVDAAGGRELVPKREWRFPVREVRLESIYGLRRPVARAADVANAIERVWGWQERVGPVVGRAYLRGTVAHLGWEALWPRWAAWIRQGLEA